MTCSIIVPIYNSEQTLKFCVDSLLCQTYKEIEIILVDDGSTDSSSIICDDYLKKDIRAKVIHQNNAGTSEARYAGVKIATGDWITFVDSDDSLKPDAIAKLMAAVSKEIDIVIGNAKELKPFGIKNNQIITNEELRPLTVRAEGQIGLMWENLFRREVLTHAMFDFGRNITMGEDYIFWLRLVFSTNAKAIAINEQVYLKGESHICKSFVWTPEYAYAINELRRDAIPETLRKKFLPDMLEDRICNLWLVSFWTPRKEWQNCRFRKEILEDMDLVHRSFTVKERILFSLPSRLLRRKFLGFCNRVNRILKY